MQYEQQILGELRGIKSAIKEQGSSGDIEELKEKVNSIETLLSKLVVDISDMEMPSTTWISISEELYYKLLYACAIKTSVYGDDYPLPSADDLKVNATFENAITEIDNCYTYRVFGYSVWDDDTLDSYTAIALCKNDHEYGLIRLEQ